MEFSHDLVEEFVQLVNMKKNQKIIGLVLAGILLLILIQTFRLATVVRTSASASTVCSIGEKAASCSISQFTALRCENDPDLTYICIEGITADGMEAFFTSQNFDPNYCEYSCSYRGFGGQSGATGVVIGSVADGCYASFRTRGEYHGGNGFVADCSVVFREDTGECMTASQCDGKLHPSCLGDWSCVDSKCIWTCREDGNGVNIVTPVLFAVGVVTFIVYTKRKKK